MTDEELAELRVYMLAEVARMLNIPEGRPERWVPEGRVPHLRAGVSRGVEFTAGDIREIGRMPPELMGGRRGGRRAGPLNGRQAAAAPRVEPSAETIAGWAPLTAPARTPDRDAPPLTPAGRRRPG
jgi:hypothetical protein